MTTKSVRSSVSRLYTCKNSKWENNLFSCPFARLGNRIRKSFGFARAEKKPFSRMHSRHDPRREEEEDAMEYIPSYGTCRENKLPHSLQRHFPYTPARERKSRGDILFLLSEIFLGIGLCVCAERI